MDSSRMLQGPYGSLDRDKHLIRLPFTHFAVATVCLPLIGLVTCITTSLALHFNEATYTHCQVSNYLPSISAAISLTPERYIWRLCIGLHSAPRFLVAAAYFSFYRGRLAGRLLDQLLSVLVLLSSLAENVGLLLLTYVSSTEDYALHKSGFIVFLGGSIVHMLLTCRLWQVIRRFSLSTEEVTSFRNKVRCLVCSATCCALALYFFRRHNKYCEAGVYTFFALCEYLVVLSNMAFHMTAFWDFGNKEVTVATPPEGKRF
ncbi:acyltransferase PGAP2 [Denticeps clupeoides]|uniref:Acyltransferase PGAP2 n=1 Tax=Denticeps clupeoides TaxID=299321 RepID=A0AAY4CW21_9TELE|nr:post-GPI attachment to proteins factor 2 [Denticeps clupeoides]